MKLGIIAGGGSLPGQLVQAAEVANIPYHIVALDGQVSATDFIGKPVSTVRMGAAGRLFSVLQANQITDLVMIGRIRRPSLLELRPDWTLLRMLPSLGLASLGDDGLLKNVIKQFEARNFRVRGIHEFLPRLLAPEGVWTKTTPAPNLMADIQHGISAAKMLGQADIGQAVVVQDGLVIAAEAIEGTDAMLRRSAENKRAGGPGVLVKLCKPQQDKRVDMPTIGVETVRQAAAAGLAGIVVSASRTLVDGYDDTVSAANQHHMFIIGVQD